MSAARRLHGAIVTAEGRFLMATVGRGRAGWRLCSVRRWHPAPWNMERLCGRGVTLGVPSHWAGGEVRAEEIQAQQAGPVAAATCRAHSVEVQESSDWLRRNLLAVATADAALLTVPLHMAGAPDDFLSAMPLGGCWAVGLVKARTLQCVLRMAPGTPEALGSHTARVRRYAAQTTGTDASGWPVYVLAGAVGEAGECRAVAVQGPGRRPASLDEIRAAGVALAALEPGVPRFAGPSAESAGRVLRAWLYGAAAAVVLVALGVAGWVLERSLAARTALAERKASYEQMLAASGESRELAAQNRELAERIVALHAARSHRTRWAEFLQMLADVRVEGLYVELLGSEPQRDDPGAVRIALSGSAAKDSDVTAFIGALQKAPYLSDITGTLDHGRGSAPAFRVLCVLRLSGT